jgi:hypothetical protein
MQFCHVVSAQVYGTARVSKIARQRWQAESLDTLLEVYSALRVRSCWYYRCCCY